MAQDIDKDILKIFRKATLIAAKEVKEIMKKNAKIAINRFYNDYSPKYYKRTGNLRNSYTAYIDSEFGHASKNEVKRRDRNKSVSHSAYVEFSTDNMPHDYHSPSNGGGLYHKAAVMTYSYMLGYHGGAFITQRQNRKEGVLERQIKWFGDVPQKLKNGNTVMRDRTVPSPDTFMEVRMDALYKNPVRLNAIMEGALDEAFTKMSKELDRIMNKAG